MHRRAKTSVVFECGYYGALLQSATYQDGTLSESFSLEGFTGISLVITDYKDLPKDWFEAMRPTCPACGQTGKVTFAMPPYLF